MYLPEPYNGRTVEDLTRYTITQLQRIANTLKSLEVEELRFTVLHSPPLKPREGAAYYADGTNWNPGYGKGLYIYTTTFEPVITVYEEYRPYRARLRLISYPPVITNG